MRRKAASLRIPALRPRPLTLAVAATLSGAAASWPAFAQQADGPRALEEVVVTASRRETSVQDLPFNITAVGAATIERDRIENLADLARWVPGLTVVDQGARGSNLMVVRGLNVDSLNGTEFLDNGSGDTVATYVGEIPLYLDMRLADVERVEVLIGPQGTLYGAGTLGGAVRYIPHAPDTQSFSFGIHGRVFGLAESDDMGYDADFVVNVPIVEGKLAFRGVVSSLDDPGFIDYPYLVREPGVSNPEPDFNDPADVAANLYRVDDANFVETTSGRLALLWDVNDSVEATFNYYFQDQNVGGRSINHRDAFGTGPYESGHRFLEPNDRENSLFSMEIVADLGFAELTSATGVSRYDELGQRDQTDLLLDFEFGYETFPSFAAYTREIAHEDRLNQELRLVSTGTERVNWIVGLFYNEWKLDATSEEFVPGIPEFWNIDLPTGDLEYLQVTKETVTEQALFGEIGYEITDRWNVTFGGRWFDYEDDQYLAFDIPLVAIANEQPNTATDDGFLGKINTSFRFTDGVTGYATLSEGYRLGGVNSVAPCQQPLPAGQNVCAMPDEILIKPDRTTNFEVGVHNTLADGRLQLNAAVYTIDWEDIQTAGLTENGAIPITVNGGNARSRGVELGFRLAGGGPWSFAGSYAYNDAELTSDAPGLVDGADAFSGDRLAGTPREMGSFSVDYARPLANGWDLDLRYGLTATSDVLTKVGSRNGGETLGGYTLHNLSASLGKERWSATLFANNLTNKFAATGVRLDPSYIRSVAGFSLRRYFRNVLEPRSIGIEFRYSFGD